MSDQELQKEQELILASIKKVESDYYKEIDDLVKIVKKQNKFQWQEFNSNLVDVYFNNCDKLFGILLNFINSPFKDTFTFEDYKIKRASFKTHHQSVFNQLYFEFFPK